jgi:hypothetical protein
VDRKGSTPLHNAVKRQDLPSVLHLINSDNFTTEVSRRKREVREKEARTRR